uniref:Uncharacterized protein n=1 Tax=Sus scrofa TaxID=9823 RepID=A0A8D1NCJ3_PIG
MSCLYLLDINLILVILSANIFPLSVGSLFVLLMISFGVQQLLSFLIGSHLFIFAFVSFVWGDRSKKIFLRFMLKSVLPMFSSRGFMASSVTFRSLIHFEFIIGYGERECSNFILLHVVVQFSQQHVLKRLSFTIVYSCLLCYRLMDLKHMDLFCISVSCYIDLCVCFCVISQCFDYDSFVV